MAYKDPERKKEWYQKNKEKVKAYYKKWRQENREKVKAYYKKWCQENREKVKAHYKKWDKNNRERRNAHARAWYEENKTSEKERKKLVVIELQDFYVKEKLRNQGLALTTENIELKRLQLKLRRKIYETERIINPSRNRTKSR